MKNPKSLILIAIQLVTLLYLFITGPLIPSDPIIFLIFIAGIALGLWAAYSFRTTKFTWLPEIPENAALVTAGPYRIIRHPMYTAVILITAALLINEPSAPRLIVWVILLADLLYKTMLEESYLHHHFKQYGEYVVNTQRLIPFLY
jgi:protein-S-isoprenylcysteine O-methyltransferase Ste14